MADVQTPLTPGLIRSSLTLQLVLLAVLPAILATAGVTLVMSRQHLRSVEELTRSNAQMVALQLAEWAQTPLSHIDRRALLRLARAGTSQALIQQVQFWSAEGELLASSTIESAKRYPGMQVMAPIASANPGAGPNDARGGQVIIEFSLANVEAAERRAWLNMIMALGASLLGVAFAGTWAARRISAPVRQLAQAVDQLGAGEPARVDQGGAAEILHLQQGFNRAAAALLDSRRTLETRIQQATFELEKKNRQIELASQAKTRLLAAASHDLRQPLHALTLFSEGLAHGETDPLRLQRIKYVRECVESLDHLFSELLNISQIDAGVLKPQRSDFALDRLFDDVSRNFRPVAEAQELRLVVRQTDLWVNSDYYMLSRIVSNLVANSVRHTVSGGVLVAARRRGADVRIDVIDTGVGIAPEYQERIFEEFYQLESRAGTKGRGMGLGLATVQRLAALLETDIRLTSIVDRGTCVRVRVPAAMPKREHNPTLLATPEPTDSVSLADMFVLVIDDEPTILEGLRVVISGWGATVLSARSGAEALALADQWDKPPDVVVIDLHLREGEEGLTVLEALRHHPRGIGASTARLFVTGETNADSLQAARDSGVPVFHKPLTPLQLQRIVQQQLRVAREALSGHANIATN